MIYICVLEPNYLILENAFDETYGSSYIQSLYYSTTVGVFEKYPNLELFQILNDNVIHNV